MRGTDTGATGPRDAPSRLTIGQLQTNVNQFVGSIDEVAIYDRVLQAHEIAGHAQTGVPRLADQRGTPFLLRVGSGIDIGAFELQSIDFGDAPESYGTNTADGGASHQAIGLRIGSTRDDEFDESASALAMGDDDSGSDNE